MTYFRYVFWAIVALCLIVAGLANREPVTLHALPEPLSAPLGLSLDIEMPLFMVIFIGVGLGLVIGFLWEWVREYRIRSDARAKSREVDDLKREIDSLKAQKHEGKDEILAVLEQKTG